MARLTAHRWLAHLSFRGQHPAAPPATDFLQVEASVDATKADLEGGKYSGVGSALRELCGERAAKFEHYHMALLHEAYYRSTAALLRATREGLNSAGLPPALIDIIITRQEGSLQPKRSASALERFAQALQEGSVERVQISDTCEAAYLPDGVTWPDTDSNVLHIRHFFDEFVEKVLCRFDGRKAGFDRWVICGTEDLGKSAFGAWLCTQVVAQILVVVYQNERINGWVVVKPSLGAAPARVRRGDGPAAVGSVPELLESNTVFISDGFTPPIEDIPFTVFITPPRRSRYHQYTKSHSKMVYLPVYGKEEILDLRDVCFPHLDVAGVEARFGRWGGIPRSVLLKAGADEQEDLESTIRSLRYGNALLLLNGEEPTTLATDKAVHIKVKGEFPCGPGLGDVAFYELHSHRFGSKYIKDVVFRTIPDHERRALRARIRSGTYLYRAQRVVAVYKLELELRLQLITGGQFTVRRVADGKIDVRTLPI